MTVRAPSARTRGDATVRVHAQFGSYEVLSRLGEGGMAEVFVARALGIAGFERLVALKRMKPSFASDPEFVGMFLDEARIASAIRSAHVVATLDLGRDSEGALFIVMDLVPGGSLRSMVKASSEADVSVSIPLALEIALQASRGLQDAHEATDIRGRPLNVVHRDVSPDNMLLGLDGVLRLTDFGIARAADRLTRTATGVVKGKFGYMAPETMQASVEVDQRADVFSLGVVLWELLCRRRLFGRATPLATARALMAEPIPAPSTLRMGVPPALDALVLHMLQRDRSVRITSAAEVCHQIESIVRDQQLHASRSDLARFARNHTATSLVDLLESRSLSSHPPTAVTVASETNKVRPSSELAPLQTTSRSSRLASWLRRWADWLERP